MKLGTQHERLETVQGHLAQESEEHDRIGDGKSGLAQPNCSAARQRLASVHTGRKMGMIHGQFMVSTKGHTIYKLTSP